MKKEEFMMTQIRRPFLVNQVPLSQMTPYSFLDGMTPLFPGQMTYSSPGGTFALKARLMQPQAISRHFPAKIQTFSRVAMSEIWLKF